MAEVTRRGFLAKTSAGAAGLGVLATAPGMALAASRHHPAPDAARIEVAGPIVAHVRDAAAGEIAVYAGDREVIIHDRELVARLAKAIR